MKIAGLIEFSTDNKFYISVTAPFRVEVVISYGC
jgi:hypothetical protein